MFDRKSLIFMVVFAVYATTVSAIELKDPTKPPRPNVDGAVLPSIRGDLSLTSIIISERSRRALINGEVVRKGDVIGGETITAIQPGYVEVADSGLRRKLFLVPSGFKKSVRRSTN